MADTDQVVDPTVDDEIEEDIPEPVIDQRGNYTIKHVHENLLVKFFFVLPQG